MTGSIYSGDPGVDRHHLTIHNTHSICPSSWFHALLPSFHRSMQFVRFLKHSCQTFIDPGDLCRSSWAGILSYPVTLCLRSSSQNCSFYRNPFRCHARCGRVLKMSSLPSRSTVSPHCDRVNSELLSKAAIR